MWYSNLKKKHLFLDISSTNIYTLVPLHYQCVETRSIEMFFFYCCLSHFRIWSGIACYFETSFREFLGPVVNRFTRQTLPTVNISLRISFALHLSPFAHNTNNRTLLLGCTLLKHGRHFDYWNQRVTMRMLVCFLDCHQAGLCCYLVRHTGNVLRPLQLFYFNLWFVYWLSPVQYLDAGQGLGKLAQPVTFLVIVLATRIL
jgi:hypothetical protein